MKRAGGKSARWLLAFLLIAAVALAGAGAWAWRTLQQPYKGWSGDQVQVSIEPGMRAAAILARLEREGVVADAHLARAYLVYQLGDPPLKAGEYAFREPLSTPQVLERLVRGEVVTYPVTLIEGLTRQETAESLARSGFGDADRFLAATASPALIADLDPQATDLEGYLFPDTYHFARGTPEEDIVATLVATFRRHWNEEIVPLLAARRVTSGAPSAGSEEEPGQETGDAVERTLPAARTVRQIVTLASVVEKEAQLDSERPIIAGVYSNRLRHGIALYADPTVIYALKQLGTWDGNLRRPDLEIDSPYNTYRYSGLPPGPIASPGLASLKAAARPADVPYRYFVSRNDGSHAFAETLAEHNRNVERWQRRYWRERWARERAAEKNPGGDQEPPVR